MRQQVLTREGTALALSVRAGSGRPLVVVPGAMSDAAGWWPVVEGLSRPNPVLVLNRRGRAPSGPLGDGYSVATEVEDLLHVLDWLDDDCDLFGWSYGGLIAVEAAVRSPAVRSLTLYEPVMAPFATHALPALERAAAVGDLDLSVELVNTDVSGYPAERVAELRATRAWDVLRPLAAAVAGELQAINAHRVDRDAYRCLRVPVRLLLGELNEGRDPYGTSFARFAAAMPAARVVRLAGQGHLAHVEAPGLLARHIEEALTPVGRQAEDVDTHAGGA